MVGPGRCRFELLMARLLCVGLWLLMLAACQATLSPSVDSAAPVVVLAVEQTEPVGSLDDAADDPAIWVHPSDPQASLILGTDKRAGLYLYRLNGEVMQFLPIGWLNNVDLRQGVTAAGWHGDLAAATNRSDDSVVLFSISALGATQLASFPASEPEPYGLCLATLGGEKLVFVTYKNGAVVAHALRDGWQAPVVGRWKLGSQVEGCVHDDEAGRLFVGEENAGLWTATTRLDGNDLVVDSAVLVDRVGGSTGLVADVEGVALYQRSNGTGYVIASSQGNNSYTVYQRQPPHQFLGRFTIGLGGADAVEETDGIAINSASFGPQYMGGLMVAQDGIRPNGEQQNFKLVSWEHVAEKLRLP